MTELSHTFETARGTIGPLERVLSAIPAIVLFYVILLNPLLTEGATVGSAENNIAAAEPNRLNQLFWLGLFGLTLFSAGNRIFVIFDRLKNPAVLFIAAYLVLAFASVTWSPVPGIALRRILLQTIFVLVLAIPILVSRDTGRVISGLLAVLALAVWINVIAVIIVPPSPIGHVGLYAQKNALGATMAGAFLFMMFGFFTRRGAMRWVYLATAFAALALVVMSQSKTSLALGIAAPAAAFGLIAISRGLNIGLTGLFLFSAVFGLACWFFFSQAAQFAFSDLSMLLFDDETFTGRTTIWAFSLEAIERSPVLGHGYASFWATGTDSSVFREAPGFVASLLQSHSGYLDVLIETGAVGFSLLVLLLVFTLTQIARLARHMPGLAWLCLTILIFAMVHNSMESSWFRGFSFLWLQFLLAALLPASQRPAKPDFAAGRP
ncbi:hypothetical protein GCM10011316_20680 [Roseibium aquae]|uniref:O-antigen ligase-related domain-containing protein n=1 Tax=Roseibium aquae TaxID=1323746 RepID=A0A916TK29_9HYPH|nr:O-antigen ligase family protein [Roseibium aquae]GGB48394.1 hypothetical protein GCM10011316_20680 [Roseibium aquae]